MIENWINLIERQQPVCQLNLYHDDEFYATSAEKMTFADALQIGIRIIFEDPAFSYVITCVEGVPI